MTAGDTGIDALIELAARGDGAAREQLFECYRGRLRQMVSIRLDRRLAARLDPSDVVQEALLEAARNLTDYLHRPPLPFYPWLRQFAWNRLVDLHRRHLLARRRSVACEAPRDIPLPDAATASMADRLLPGGPGPGQGWFGAGRAHAGRA